MKGIFAAFFIVFFTFSIYPNDMGSSLIVVEEAENGAISPEESPFADGVYDALWEKCTSIFFDVRIKDTIPLVSDKLDVKPYIDTAKKNCADSIILIKLNYISKEKGDNLELKVDDVIYNFYSLNKFAVLKSGKKSINYSKTILKKNKESVLKKIGYDFLTEVYN